jgi:hypothetical protein
VGFAQQQKTKKNKNKNKNKQQGTSVFPCAVLLTMEDGDSLSMVRPSHRVQFRVYHTSLPPPPHTFFPQLQELVIDGGMVKANSSDHRKRN